MHVGCIQDRIVTWIIAQSGVGYAPTVPIARLTREQSQAETRKRLIDAAADLFAAQGFYGTSVAEIAERAGFTTGAVYSNFDRKEELALAVQDDLTLHWVNRLREALAAGGAVADRIAAVDRWYRAMIEQGPEWTLLSMELSLRARHDDELRAELAQRSRATRDGLASLLVYETEQLGVTLPQDAHSIAAAILALGDGLAVEYARDRREAVLDTFSRVLPTLLGLVGTTSSAANQAADSK